jgi:two-component system sensor histidine kinase GlrK
VFEPFFQGARQPDSAIRGSGLGLAIVRESLRSVGGEIGLVERASWSTCFRLNCPCTVPAP